eukprot:361816-Chlamydomonas_euryale.AAC.5
MHSPKTARRCLLHGRNASLLRQRVKRKQWRAFACLEATATPGTTSAQTVLGYPPANKPPRPHFDITLAGRQANAKTTWFLPPNPHLLPCPLSVLPPALLQVPAP